jgi:hypothetical protein
MSITVSNSLKNVKEILVKQLVEKFPSRFPNPEKASSFAGDVVTKLTEISVAPENSKYDLTDRLARTLANTVHSDVTNTRALVTEWLSIPLGVNVTDALLEADQREVVAKILEVLAPHLSGYTGIPFIGPVLKACINFPKLILPPAVTYPFYFVGSKAVGAVKNVVGKLPFLKHSNPVTVIEAQGREILMTSAAHELKRALQLFAASWIASMLIASFLIKVEQTMIATEPGHTTLSYVVSMNLGYTKAVIPVPNAFFGNVVVLIIVYVLQKVVAGILYTVIVCVTARPPTFA